MYDSPEFLELRKQWYDRLAEEGFHDIEKVDWGTGGTLEIVPHSLPRSKWDGQKAEYYYLLEQWANKAYHEGRINRRQQHACTEGADWTHSQLAKKWRRAYRHVHYERRKLHRMFLADLARGYLDDGYAD